MYRQRRRILFATLGMGLAASVGVRANDQSARANRLIIAYNDDYAPYSYIEDDVVKGILPDILDPLLGSLAALKIERIGLPQDQIMSIPEPFVAAEVPFHLLVSKTHPRAAEILRHLDGMLRKPGVSRMIDGITRRYV